LQTSFIDNDILGGIGLEQKREIGFNFRPISDFDFDYFDSDPGFFFIANL